SRPRGAAPARSGGRPACGTAPRTRPRPRAAGPPAGAPAGARCSPLRPPHGHDPDAAPQRADPASERPLEAVPPREVGWQVGDPLDLEPGAPDGGHEILRAPEPDVRRVRLQQPAVPQAFEDV